MADGDLVVADTGNHRVQVVREDGTFVRWFGSEGLEDGRFIDVCVGPDGSIAVLDLGNRRVQIIDGEGGFVRSIGSRGEGPGQFMDPYSVASGAGGEIIVADIERKDVQVFSKEGQLLQIIGAGGDSDVAFGDIQGIATDAEGAAFRGRRQHCRAAVLKVCPSGLASHDECSARPGSTGSGVLLCCLHRDCLCFCHDG